MKSLITKLMLVQAELKPIIKSEDNPFFKSKYADINAILASLRLLLVKHGVLVMQPLTTNEQGHQAIETILMDEEGNSLTRTVELPTLPDIQKFGAAVTYMRRFALVSMFALESEDADGEDIVQRAATPSTMPQASSKPLPVASGASRQENADKCKSCGGPMSDRPSPKNNKHWCVSRCWLNKRDESVPVIQRDEVSIEDINALIP